MLKVLELTQFLQSTSDSTSTYFPSSVGIKNLSFYFFDTQGHKKRKMCLRCLNKHLCQVGLKGLTSVFKRRYFFWDCQWTLYLTQFVYFTIIRMNLTWGDNWPVKSRMAIHNVDRLISGIDISPGAQINPLRYSSLASSENPSVETFPTVNVMKILTTEPQMKAS